MASDLPFHVAPALATEEIGTAETGILRFRKVGSISIAERTAVREVDTSDEQFVKAAELTQAIHSQEGGTRTRAEVYAEIQRAINGDPNEIALTWIDEVQELRDRKEAGMEAAVIRKATTMICNRLNNCADWTDADTRALESEALILAISRFYDQEMLGVVGMDALRDVHQQLKDLEEALGKLQPAPGSPPPNPTGETSTGDAEPPMPAAPSLSESGLATSQSPTSSKPRQRRPRQS